MTVKIEKFNIITQGFNDLIDITAKIQAIVSNYSFSEALVNISTPSSTASILTLEQEPGLGDDLIDLIKEIIPLNKVYKHDTLWHEGNAQAHLRAAVFGNNITLSAVNKNLLIDNYQKIVLIDFDNKPATKTVVVSITY